jgi:hypothetical protein
VLSPDPTDVLTAYHGVHSAAIRTIAPIRMMIAPTSLNAFLLAIVAPCVVVYASTV